ncbi:facilitated trehalose transporter Tret1-like [Diorhabda carinulata]|uniref:facilitated trehalose transporter Tret1-like n=1 Tax=Diorhabda carinulata TaxID=1163345 RepID=UPI0025A0EBE9|nr:facilitated trehalose transporter Tret1-like [Diorhabda carinulata]
MARAKNIQFIVSIAATIISITDGMTVAWSAPMIPYFISENSHIQMTQDQAEWIETCFLIGVIIAIPITAYLTNKLGRKKCLLLAATVLMLCWIAIGCVYKKEYIYVARVFMGMGTNLGFVSVPVYIGEIAQKEIRGFLTSFMQIMVIIGILIMYCIGPFTSFSTPPFLAAGLLMSKLVIFSFMPDTPYILCMKNDVNQAKKSLQKLRGKEDVEEELQEIMEAINNDMRDKKGAFKELFVVNRYRNASIIVLVFDFTKLCSCFEVVLMNMHQMLDQAGSVYIKPSSVAIIFAVLLLISSLISSVTIDKFGRKIIFFVSSMLTALCLLLLGIFLNLNQKGYNVQAVNWIPAVSVMIYAVVFKLGMGTVPFVILGEIYSTRIKGRGIAFCNGFHTLTSLGVFQVYFMLRRAYGIYIHFYIFSFLTVFTAVVIMYFVPETRGKSLEEIQQLLKENVFFKTSKKIDSDCENNIKLITRRNSGFIDKKERLK